MTGSVKDLIVRMLVDDKELDKFTKAADKPIQFGDALNKASAVSVAALGGIAAAATTAAVKAGELEQESDQLAASLGLTEQQAANAGEAAGNAYGNAFGGSLEEVNAATAGIVSSIDGMRDASVERLQDITEKVSTLSPAFGVEADRISQVVGQMLSTGLASSAEEGLDLLTATLQKVPAAVRADVLDAVDEYGPFFAGIGISGEAAMSALVKASEKGMYGIDKTGDALKELSIRAVDMSALSVSSYEAAGLSAEEMSAKFIAGGATAQQGFQQVIDGLLGIEDPVTRANAAIGLFGTPLEDLGVNEIPAFLSSLSAMSNELGDVSGAAERMSDTMGDNVATTWEGVQRRLELAAGKMGETFLPVLGELVGGLGAFADWAGDNTEVVVAIGGAVAVVATGILAVSAAMKIYAAAQAIQTAAQWASNAAWLASPVTWIVLGIIAAVALLVAAGWAIYENWDQISAWLGDAWQWLGETWDGVVGRFELGGQQIGDGWQAVVDRFALGGEQIGTWWSDVVDRFELGGQQIGDGWQWVVGRFELGSQQIGDGWQAVVDRFELGGEQIGGWWADVVDRFELGGQQIGDGWNNVAERFELGGQQIGDGWDTVVGRFELGGQQIGDGWQTVVGRFELGGQQIRTFWDDTVTGFGRGVDTAGQWWGSFVVGIETGAGQVGLFWQSTVTAFGVGVDTVGQWWGGLVMAVQTGAGQVGAFWDGTVNNFGAGVDRISSWWGGLIGFFTDGAAQIGTGMHNAFAAAFNAISRGWNDTLGSVSVDLPGWMGGGKLEFPRMGSIPMLADGGVATAATLAIIGEAGPEVVVPLDRAEEFGFGRGGGQQVVEVHSVTQLDGAVIARSVKRHNVREGW